MYRDNDSFTDELRESGSYLMSDTNLPTIDDIEDFEETTLKSILSSARHGDCGARQLGDFRSTWPLRMKVGVR